MPDQWSGNTIALLITRQMALDYGLVTPTADEQAELNALTERSAQHAAAMAEWERGVATYVVADHYGMLLLCAIRNIHSNDSGDCAACQETWPCVTLETAMRIVGDPPPEW